MPEALASRGIACAAFGKWHLSSAATGGELGPNLQGFGHFAGTWGNIPQPRTYYDWDRTVNGLVAPSTTYATTQTVDDALVNRDLRKQRRRERSGRRSEEGEDREDDEARAAVHEQRVGPRRVDRLDESRDRSAAGRHPGIGAIGMNPVPLRLGFGQTAPALKRESLLKKLGDLGRSNGDHVLC